MVLLTRVRYREKSPAPKVTGGRQGSGSRRASHGKVDHISGRKENTSRAVINTTCCLDLLWPAICMYIVQYG